MKNQDKYHKQPNILTVNKKVKALFTDAILNKANYIPYTQMINHFKDVVRSRGYNWLKESEENLNKWANCSQDIVTSYLLQEEQDKQGLCSFVRLIHKLREQKDENYLFSESLTDALENINLKVKAKFLPKDIVCFIQFPYLAGHQGPTPVKIEGTIVETKSMDNGNLMLTLCHISEKGFKVSYNLIEAEKMEWDITDILNKEINIPSRQLNGSSQAKDEAHVDFLKIETTPVSNLLPNQNKTKEVEEFEFLDDGWKCVIDPNYMVISALIYLSSQKQELNDQFRFKAKNSVLPKVYTSCGYVLVGENFINVRKINPDSWKVSGHFRWQPYGEGMKKIKIIFIREYQKRFQPVYIEDDEAQDQSQLNSGWRQWEKEDRQSFNPALKIEIEKLERHLDLKIEYFEEYQVRHESLHRIDYLFRIPKLNLVIGFEYKSSKAKWSNEKIREQLDYYHYHLSQRYKKKGYQVQTYLVSDNGKYGISEKEALDMFSQIGN